MKSPTTVLVAPLNWGLGHATRCIPIIRFLIQQNVKVLLASDGRALHLLQKEFPELPSFELPSYRITYPTSNMAFNFVWQMPRFFRAIRLEKKAVAKICREQAVDIVISDNRFGCFSKKTYNVFMTHQVNIPIPVPVVRAMGNFYNRKKIRQFDECWIPDFKGEKNLAGKLSHGHNIEITKYIGALSRMKKMDLPICWKAIVILSGPEPQRTFLEKKIMEQALELPHQFLIVKGQTEKKAHFFLSENVEVVSFLTSKKLNEAIAESEIVISRSGYTTLMDLVFLEKKAILIPTPGQTEQEYLAAHFSKQKIFATQKQAQFNLKKALEAVENFSGFEERIFQKNLFQKNVIELLEKI